MLQGANPEWVLDSYTFKLQFYNPYANDHKCTVSSRVPFEAYDDHSGLKQITWQLLDMRDGTSHGDGAVAVVRAVDVCEQSLILYSTFLLVATFRKYHCLAVSITFVY